MGSSVVLATAGYDHTIRQAAAWAGRGAPGQRPPRRSVSADRRRSRCRRANLTRAATAGRARAACRRFWEATSGICYRTLQYADSQVNKLEITADKTLIAAAGNPHIR